jgi:hypothetical protein
MLMQGELEDLPSAPKTFSDLLIFITRHGGISTIMKLAKLFAESVRCFFLLGTSSSPV